MEVVIVDDNSPDGTQERVKELQKIYGEDKIVLNARPGKMGLGSAYIDGLKRCKGDYVVLMDADLSHHVSKSDLILWCSLNSFLSILTKWRRPGAIWSLELVICPEEACTGGT